MYSLDTPLKTEYAVLLDIWEASVKATHHFLTDKDIEFYKNTIREKQVFNHVSITCLRDTENAIIGFMGVMGDSLEMIFLKPSVIGQGAGKILLLHAIENLNVKRVDVNEQNVKALQLYERFGFKVISRSELDGTGKPYPILHMQLIK